MQTIETILGSPFEQYCDRLVAERPQWITGSLSHEGARFLFRTALDARADTYVEIGTASGFSAVVACRALDVASRAGLIGSDYRVVSYDASETFYADRTKRVGDAAREQLPPALLERIEFRNPAVAADAADELGPGTLSLLLIDANHRHPWPTLDLLATLKSLAPGAVVVFDDINLPILSPQFEAWGAKYLFDALSVQKTVSSGYSSRAGVPCMGSITIPSDKEALRAELLHFINAYAWEASVHDAYLTRLGVPRRA